jgi:glycerophosphoryl diester phosphodiesterase
MLQKALVLKDRQEKMSAFRLLFVLVFCYAFGVSAQEMSDYQGPWRQTLDGADACWTEPRSVCNRPLYVMHGGNWDIKHPYDSFPAFKSAWMYGADAIKGDFRVNGENVGMVMHSSPVLAYESPNCFNKNVEEMSTTECEQCKMEITDYTFISSKELLAWADGLINTMFCVKKNTDIPRAIESLIEYNATHRAFLEVGMSDYVITVSSSVPDWNKVYFVVEVDAHSDVETLLSLPKEAQNRAFLAEFNHWDDDAHWPSQEQQQADIVALNAIGIRTFASTHDNKAMATVQNHLDIYERGFDVVYSYNLEAANDARGQVNFERGLPNGKK